MFAELYRKAARMNLTNPAMQDMGGVQESNSLGASLTPQSYGGVQNLMPINNAPINAPQYGGQMAQPQYNGQVGIFPQEEDVRRTMSRFYSGY